MPLLIKMLLLCWSSCFPEMSRRSPPACCAPPAPRGRANSCRCLLVAKGPAPFPPCHPWDTGLNPMGPESHRLHLCAAPRGPHSPCVGTGAGRMGLAVVRGCSFGVSAGVPRSGRAAGSLGRGARVPTSICEHSLGVRAGVAERVLPLPSRAGGTGEGVRGTGKVLSECHLLPEELFYLRASGTPIPVCPERCRRPRVLASCRQCSGDKDTGEGPGRVKPFLPPARAVEEPPRLAGLRKRLVLQLCPIRPADRAPFSGCTQGRPAPRAKCSPASPSPLEQGHRSRRAPHSCSGQGSRRSCPMTGRSCPSPGFRRVQDQLLASLPSSSPWLGEPKQPPDTGWPCPASPGSTSCTRLWSPLRGQHRGPRSWGAQGPNRASDAELDGATCPESGESKEGWDGRSGSAAVVGTAATVGDKRPPAPGTLHRPFSAHFTLSWVAVQEGPHSRAGLPSLPGFPSPEEVVRGSGGDEGVRR